MTLRTLIAVASVVCLPGLLLAELGPLERVQTIGYELDEIEELAGRVARRAQTVRRAAERVADPAREEAARTLEFLVALEKRAETFHEDVGRFGRGFSNAEGDFGEVQRAYIRLARAMSDLGDRSKVRDEFDRLSDAMFELEMYTVDLLTRIHLADERGAGRTSLASQSETGDGQEGRGKEIAQASRFEEVDWATWDCLDVALR